jgi:hypothetical protein
MIRILAIESIVLLVFDDILLTKVKAALLNMTFQKEYHLTAIIIGISKESILSTYKYLK